MWSGNNYKFAFIVKLQLLDKNLSWGYMSSLM